MFILDKLRKIFGAPPFVKEIDTVFVEAEPIVRLDRELVYRPTPQGEWTDFIIFALDQKLRSR